MKYLDKIFVAVMFGALLAGSVHAATYIHNKPGLPSPDTSQIHLDVAASTMTNKSLEHIRWDEDTGKMVSPWASSLSVDDKALFDTIVSTY